MRSIDDSFGFLFAKASESFQDALLPALDKAALNTKQMGLLMIIQEHDGISQKKAGAIQRVDRTTTMQTVDYLEKAGMVKRIQNQNDRRAYNLHSTEKGRLVMAELWKQYDIVQNRLLGDLSRRDVDSLQALLLRIVRKDDQDEC